MGHQHPHDSVPANLTNVALVFHWSSSYVSQSLSHSDHPEKPNPLPWPGPFSTSLSPLLKWYKAPESEGFFGFFTSCLRRPLCHIKILRSYKSLCFFFSCYSVCCSFNLRVPGRKHKKVEEKFFLPYRSKEPWLSPNSNSLSFLSEDFET